MVIANVTIPDRLLTLQTLGKRLGFNSKYVFPNGTDKDAPVYCYLSLI